MRRHPPPGAQRGDWEALLRTAMDHVRRQDADHGARPSRSRRSSPAPMSSTHLPPAGPRRTMAAVAVATLPEVPECVASTLSLPCAVPCFDGTKRRLRIHRTEVASSTSTQGRRQCPEAVASELTKFGCCEDVGVRQSTNDAEAAQKGDGGGAVRGRTRSWPAGRWG